MPSSKHTPGPWYRNIRAKGKDPTVFAGSAPNHVHVAHIQQIRDNPEETEANIDLIAAAPELLARLKEAVDCLEARIRGAVLNNEPYRIGEMRKAILEAEGRS